MTRTILIMHYNYPMHRTGKALKYFVFIFVFLSSMFHLYFLAFFYNDMNTFLPGYNDGHKALFRIIYCHMLQSCLKNLIS